MYRIQRIESLALSVLLLGLIAGGTHAPTVASPLASGGNLINIEAGSYKFKPNNIHVPTPGILALEIRNVSGSEHNFTLVNSRGEIVKNLNIRPKETAISNVDLEPGTYRFYCDKRFHASLGMKGQIVVEPAK